MRPSITILLLCIAHCLCAQQFRAHSSKQTILQGETFEVTYTLDNNKGRGFKAPSFSPFRVISGPNRSTSTTFVNGRVSGKLSFSYVLQAPNIGEFKIPGARISVGSRRQVSNEVHLKVIKNNSTNKSKLKKEDVDGQAFVKAVLDTNVAYIGQQVVLRLKLYTAINVKRYELLSQPNIQDMYIRDLRFRSSLTYEENRRYSVSGSGFEKTLSFSSKNR